MKNLIYIFVLCFIDYSRRNSNTIAHEIGHSVFDLSHSDESPNTENVNPPVTTDTDNLMISGGRTSGNINSTIIRQYLWDKIRDNLISN